MPLHDQRKALIALHLIRSKPENLTLQEHLSQLKLHVQCQSDSSKEPDSAKELRFDGVANLQSLLTLTRKANSELQRQLAETQRKQATIEASKDRAMAEAAALQTQLSELRQNYAAQLRLVETQPEPKTLFASLPVGTQQTQPLLSQSHEIDLQVSQSPLANSQQKRKEPPGEPTTRYQLRSRKKARPNPFERFYSSYLRLEQQRKTISGPVGKLPRPA